MDVLRDLIMDLLIQLKEPVNVALLFGCVVLLYLIFKRRDSRVKSKATDIPKLDPLPRQDFTLQQLAEYDGAKTPRILVAVNRKVFDVTRGRNFYGPGGPYGRFAGRDASRALATFNLDTSSFRDTFDDLSDLSADNIETVREWELQFQEKYAYVGKLLRDGEAPTDYTDTETDTDVRGGATS